MSKRFRLNLVNAAEDVPRVLTAYGRACGGELALVLRPTEGEGVLVHITKAGAYAWTAGANDAPNVPDESVEPATAVARIKEAQLKPGRQGPITLRGQWSGYLHCDGHVPIVELRRKLATYAILTIRSDPQGHWRWTVERLEQWFGGAGSDSGEAPVLLHAIEAGLGSAMGLLGQVCSQRDSKRRGAFDAKWAEKHPVRAAKERPSGTRRLKVKATASKAKTTAKERKSVDNAEATLGKPARRKRARKTPAVGTAPKSSATARRATSPPSTRPKRTSAKRAAARKGTSKPTQKAARTPAKATPPTPDQALLAAFEQAIQTAISEVS